MTESVERREDDVNVHSQDGRGAAADSQGKTPKGEKIRHLWLGSLCAIGCEIFFGLSTVFTKAATGVASGLSLLGWRFFIAFLVINLLRLLRLVKIDLRGKRIWPLFLIALFSPVLYFFLETTGIDHTTASESGAFFACIPVAALIASSVILKKKPSRLQMIGIGITVIGVLVTVVAAGLEASFSTFGYAALTLAILSYSLYCVFVERYEEYTGIEITYSMLLLGAAVFVSLALGEGMVHGNLPQLLALPLMNTGFLVAVLYQGIACSILAFFLSNVAIAHIGVNRASSFIGVSTIVSVSVGVLFLGEAFSLYQLAGVILILVGVYTANAKQSY